MKYIKNYIPSLLVILSGCFTDNAEKEFAITPDLSIGNNWLYQYRQFDKKEDGKYGDTLIYFVHYQIIGDTVFNDSIYRLMAEDDLTIFDSTLEINRTLSAIKYQHGRVVIKNLKIGGAEFGRYPFKISARNIFDTANFYDEFVALSFPIQKNSEWIYRYPDHPKGHSPAKKIFLGTETINSFGKPYNTLKFEFIIENMQWIKSFEWYSANVKIKSNSFSKQSDNNNDSVFFEEEFIDSRGFIKEDSQMVINSYRKWSQGTD
jgi:hypothetical protein